MNRVRLLSLAKLVNEVCMESVDATLACLRVGRVFYPPGRVSYPAHRTWRDVRFPPIAVTSEGSHAARMSRDATPTTPDVPGRIPGTAGWKPALSGGTRTNRAEPGNH